MSYFAGWRQLLYVLQKGRSLPIVPIPRNAVTLYTRPTPLFARLAYVLVAVDVMFTTSIVEYTWGIGDKVYELVTGPREKEEPDSMMAKMREKQQHQSVQAKFLFSGIYVFAGVLFGAAILGNRSRILTAIKYTKNSKKVYLHTASHPEGYGLVFPLKQSSLAESRALTNSVVYTVHVEGSGAWPMDFAGAEVLGKQVDNMSTTEAITMLRPVWKQIGGREKIAKAKYKPTV